MEIQLERRFPFAYICLTTLVHFVGLSNFIIGLCFKFYFDVTKSDGDIYDKFGYGLKHPSVLNAIFQMAYNSIALAVDVQILVTNVNDAPYVWLLWRSYFRSCFAFPIGMINCFSYWMFYLISPENIFKSGKSDHPLWLSHVLTTDNVIFLMLDLLVCRGESPKHILVPFLIFSLVTVNYIIWLHVIYLHTHRWAVPFLGEGNFALKMIKGTIVTFLSLFFFLLGEFINDLLWNEKGPKRSTCLSRYFSDRPTVSAIIVEEPPSTPILNRLTSVDQKPQEKELTCVGE
ncbi:androgen-induced gene 1 protein-like isoform X2 [Cimex lectularius]|uniref:Uncharacterized protein n=1 Tax=Cimex lectularius TaxID=79782 RepID=A0A8I6S342_CIMLE|nr:androgen-induced gene 1 protein-like isoform X2 [Cimex lectularius]